MDIAPIKTKRDYQRTLKEIEGLAPGGSDRRERDQASRSKMAVVEQSSTRSSTCTSPP